MAKSTVGQDALLEDVSQFSLAVLAFVDAEGYPLNVGTTFHVDASKGTIVLDTPSTPESVGEGAEVNVTFSHVRPQEGVGYDQRRYVSVWGRAVKANGVVEVTPERSHGWDEDRMSFFELCERSVPTAHRYMRKLSAERGEPVKARLSLPWLVLLATRVPFLTATFVPILLGAAIARAHGYSAWWLALLALVGGSAVHLGLNVANDVFDATSGADQANVTPTMFSGGSRMIQYGLVDLKTMKIASATLYSVGIAIGIYLVATRGIELLWIGVAGIFLSLFYTAPPFKFVYRGLGEICVALGFGPLMVLGTYFTVAQRFSLEALYASLPVALLIMLVLYVNQVPDAKADTKAGKRTIVVRLSKGAIVAGYALSAGSAFLLILGGAIAGVMPLWTLIALAPAPLAYKVYVGMKKHYENPYELMATMGENVQVHLFTGLLLIAGYALATIL